MTGRNKRRVTLAAAGIVVVAIVGLCGFSYSQVCAVCGHVEQVSQWQLPFTDVTYRTTRSIRETPLSVVAFNDHLVGPHDHKWLFAHGAGNGVMCAIGPGRHLMSVIDSPHVAAFIHNVAARATDQGTRWLRLSLDPNLRGRLGTALRVTDFPEHGFTDQDQFNAWWSTNNIILTDYLSPADP